MTEKQKMLSGKLYNSLDSELVGLRQKARLLLEEFNNSSVLDNKKRLLIIKKLFAKIGSKIHIEPPFYCDYGFNIEFGNDVYLNYNCIFLDVCKITVGSNVLFAPGVQVLTASHPLDSETRINGLEYGKPVSIGDNCWIGAGAIILPGVTIGINTVIGAGSVVTKDIPDNTLAVGNPCKLIKNL